MEEIEDGLGLLKIEELNDDLFWSQLVKNIKPHLSDFEGVCKYILNECGTALCCNRFDVGNSFEFELEDILEKCGFDVKRLPNEKRIDMCINDTYKLSIKYSSGGDIKLHNSNNSINTDMSMTDLILLTPENLYLLTNDNIKKSGVVLKDYLKGTGDGLTLKRSVLTELKKINFKFTLPIDLKVNKSNCKNRQCSEIFLKQIKREYINQKEVPG